MPRHDRQSLRLRGFDYSRSGYYFVTICVNHRRRLLGSQRGATIALRPAGEMVERVWYDLARRSVGVEIDEFVVMPDHVHGLLELIPAYLSRSGSPSGRAPAPAPGIPISPARIPAESGPPWGRAPAPAPGTPIPAQTTIGPAGRPVPVGPDMDGWSVPQGWARGPTPASASDGFPGIVRSLSDAVHRFKSFTTAEYRRGMRESGWPRVARRLWQRNYWDNIVWDPGSIDRVRWYIRNNPAVSYRASILQE